MQWKLNYSLRLEWSWLWQSIWFSFCIVSDQRSPWSQGWILGRLSWTCRILHGINSEIQIKKRPFLTIICPKIIFITFQKFVNIKSRLPASPMNFSPWYATEFHIFRLGNTSTRIEAEHIHNAMELDTSISFLSSNLPQSISIFPDFFVRNPGEI